MHLQRASSGGTVSFRSSFPLTCGGEGCIYPLPQDPRLLAKIYHHPDLERAHKLALMVAHPLEDPMAAQGHVSVAWPIDVLRDIDRRGQVVGFLMRRVSDMFPVVNFYNPAGRRQSCPLFNWYYLHQTARNLAAAFAAVHRRDSVVADVNSRNILVSQRALVTLVDTDSFQVRDPENGHTFRCPVGTAEYTPPELQERDLATVDRTVQHDCFGLAVILFQLLMEGTHPFAGIYLGRGDAPPYEERIRLGHFPYASKNGIPYRPMPVSPPLSILYPLLQHLFVRCFAEGHHDPSARPDALSWQNALEEAAASMVACRTNEQHRYGKHLVNCPWCERTRQLGGRDPFPSVQAVQKGLHLPPRPLRPPPQLKQTPRYRYGAPYAVHKFPSPLAPRTQPSWQQHILGRVKFPKWTRALLAAVLALGFGIAVLSTIDDRRRILYGLVAVCAGAATSLETFRPRWAHVHKINYTMLVLCVAAGVFIPMAISVSVWGLLVGAFWLWRLFQGNRKWSAQAGVGYALYAAMALLSSSMLNSTPGAPASPTAVRPPEPRATPVDLEHTNVPGLRQLSGHDSTVSVVAWSPDGKRLATGSLDKTVNIWQADSRRLEATLPHDNLVYAVAWSPNGKTLATGSWNGAVKLWDTKSHILRFRLPKSGSSAITSLAWSRDGKTLAGASWDKALSVWAVSNGKMTTAASDGASTYSDSWVAWSPDGRMLAISGVMQGIKLVKIRDKGSLWPYQTMGDTSSAKGPVAWSPDSKLLANGSDDSKVILWNVESQLPIRVLTSYTDRVESISWSPDGKTLAIASNNKVLLWQVDR